MLGSVSGRRCLVSIVTRDAWGTKRPKRVLLVLLSNTKDIKVKKALYLMSVVPSVKRLVSMKADGALISLPLCVARNKSTDFNSLITSQCHSNLNPLTAERVLRALIDLTLANTRRFYSSKGNPWKGLGTMVAIVWRELSGLLGSAFILEHDFRITMNISHLITTQKEHFLGELHRHY